MDSGDTWEVKLTGCGDRLSVMGLRGKAFLEWLALKGRKGEDLDK